VATYITALDDGGTGPRLAVKDLIDVAGVPTTAGCRAVADAAEAAGVDAACMAGARAADARVVGKANLVELAYGVSGYNPWFGTPANPLDPALVPGGSSSGSAVAVAEGSADVAYGSDTGGSIRIPSAFCGTVGLKTTFGRVPVAGVWPLAVSLDTVGPMARSVADTALGMALLEPGFDVTGTAPASAVGRVRIPGLDVDPTIDAAVDEALAVSGLDVVEVEVPGWLDAWAVTMTLLDGEAFAANGHLLAEGTGKGVGTAAASRLRDASTVTAAQLAAARAAKVDWTDRLAAVLGRVQVLALPTVGFFPPRLDDAARGDYTKLTNPVNMAGLPAISLPVPAPGGGALPAGLQVVGPAMGDELLLATAAVVEAAVR
jgi:amidase